MTPAQAAAVRLDERGFGAQAIGRILGSVARVTDDRDTALIAVTRCPEPVEI